MHRDKAPSAQRAQRWPPIPAARICAAQDGWFGALLQRALQHATQSAPQKTPRLAKLAARNAIRNPRPCADPLHALREAMWQKSPSTRASRRDKRAHTTSRGADTRKAESARISLGQNHGRNITKRPRQAHAMKILSQNRHHAPLNHTRKVARSPRAGVPALIGKVSSADAREAKLFGIRTASQFRSRSHFNSKLNHLRRMHNIARYIAEMRKTSAIRRARANPSMEARAQRSRRLREMTARSLNPSATTASRTESRTPRAQLY